tara:strand:- start:4540 stop:5652 length:1113 start_codon:yes stop_codon:yes gene_type:complete
MNRILKRPMFRMGGRSDDGIMSVRPGYQNGGPSLEETIAGVKLEKPRTTLFTDDFIRGEFDKFKSQYFPGEEPSMEDIGGYGEITAPIDVKDEGIMKFLTEQPEKSFELFKKGKLGGTDFEAKQKEQKKIAKDAGLNLFPDVKIADKDTSTQIKLNTEGSKTGTGDKRQSDTEVVKDYIDMFKTALGSEDDNARKQKFLALAQFGANLLGQPGGDLTGAIGRAASPAISTFGKALSDQRAAEREVAALGAQAALKKMDPGSIGKAIDDIMAANPELTRKEALDIAVRSGGATSARLSEERRQAVTGVLENEGLSDAAANRASGKIMASGIEDYRFSLLPKEPKEGQYYYDKEGKLYQGQKDGEVRELIID